MIKEQPEVGRTINLNDLHVELVDPFSPFILTMSRRTEHVSLILFIYLEYLTA